MDFEDVLTRGDPGNPKIEDRTGRYGPWTELVQELAAGDHDQAERIFGWPLRVALDAFRRLMKEQALLDYRHRFLCWCVLAPHAAKGSRPRPPQVPDILRGRRTDGHT